MSSIIVQMLPNLTLEPALMGAAAAWPRGFVPQCWCKRRSLGALEFKLCPREMCIPVKLGVCSIVAFPCFLLVLSRGCGARSLSFLTLPLHALPGPNPPVGPRPSGRMGSWGSQGKQGEYGNAPGHAATGLGPCTVRDVPSSQTCSHAFQRELLPELGCSSALPVLDKQNYCFHYSDRECF